MASFSLLSLVLDRRFERVSLALSKRFLESVKRWLLYGPMELWAYICPTATSRTGTLD